MTENWGMLRGKTKQERLHDEDKQRDLRFYVTPSWLQKWFFRFPLRWNGMIVGWAVKLLYTYGLLLELSSNEMKFSRKRSLVWRSSCEKWSNQLETVVSKSFICVRNTDRGYTQTSRDMATLIGLSFKWHHVRFMSGIRTTAEFMGWAWGVFLNG